MLPNPRSFFGVHSFTPYSRVDGTFYGTLKVLASSSISFSGALVSLNGGSSKYPWAVEEGKINSQLSLKTSEYPDFLFQLFGGASITDNNAETSGNVSSLTNKSGTSVVNATTGIASVSVVSASKTDLKFGKYVVKAASATTVNIYASSDADFGSGTSETYQDGTLSIIAVQTITSGVDTTLTGFGLKLTGGSGTIGMTTGDTATFEVRPVNSSNVVMSLGSAGSNFPEFGAIIMAKKRGNGELMEFDCPRVKGEGVPLGFDEDKWSQADVKCMVMYDPVLDYVARMRYCVRSTPN